MGWRRASLRRIEGVASSGWHEARRTVDVWPREARVHARGSRARRAPVTVTLRGVIKPMVCPDLRKEFRMSLKRKARTVAAALIVGGVSAIAAQAASAATPACGPTCLSVFSSELGTYASPNFVEHVFGGRARIGTPTGLNTASSSDPCDGRLFGPFHSNVERGERYALAPFPTAVTAACSGTSRRPRQRQRGAGTETRVPSRGRSQPAPAESGRRGDRSSAAGPWGRCLRSR